MYPELCKPIKFYMGEDATERFMKDIQEEHNEVFDFLNNPPGKIMTPLTRDQQIEFLSTENCHICDRKLEVHETRVKDHDHYTGNNITIIRS